MKYLIIISFLITGCGLTRKSTNREKQDVHNSLLSIADSLGSMSIDSTSTITTTDWVKFALDSDYNKVTEEEVKEVFNSGIIHRETKRVIKEKVQKRIEQSATTLHQDSTSKKVNQVITVSQIRKHDSSSNTITESKNINRISFLHWWLCLVIILFIVWWKRNPIIKFLTSKHKP